MRFFKNGCNEGGREIFIRNGGKCRNGRGGGYEKFLCLFTNWQRGAKPPIFQILSNPTPTVLFKLSCFCCPDHTTFEELFYLLIIC